jgi:hypothetical protein
VPGRVVDISAVSEVMLFHIWYAFVHLA